MGSNRLIESGGSDQACLVSNEDMLEMVRAHTIIITYTYNVAFRVA